MWPEEKKRLAQKNGKAGQAIFLIILKHLHCSCLPFLTINFIIYWRCLSLSGPAFSCQHCHFLISVLLLFLRESQVKTFRQVSRPKNWVIIRTLFNITRLHDDGMRFRIFRSLHTKTFTLFQRSNHKFTGTQCNLPFLGVFRDKVVHTCFVLQLSSTPIVAY